MLLVCSGKPNLDKKIVCEWPWDWGSPRRFCNIYICGKKTVFLNINTLLARTLEKHAWLMVMPEKKIKNSS